MATRAHSDVAPAGASFARIAVLVTAVLQVLTPLMPSAGIGLPIGDQSDGSRTIITPAGWAFSIWSLLYAGSFAFAIYQALAATRDNARIAALRLPAVGTFLGNAVWAAYAQIFGLSFVSSLILLATLVCALAAYRRLSAWPNDLAAGERWLARLPLSALSAWLTAAAIVNIAASLRYHGIQAEEAAATIGAAVVVVGGIIAALALLRTGGNAAYALVFMWALAAIHGSGGQESALVAGACAMAALLVGAGAFAGRARIRQRLTTRG